MKFNKYDKQLLIIGLAISLGLLGLFFSTGLREQRKKQSNEQPPNIIQNTMFIKSPDFKHNETIPAKFTCDGTDQSPELLLAGIPPETKSLAIITFDPDSINGFTHWLLWNIPAETERILSDTIPEGTVVGKNDFGKNIYGGPCPSSGTHHYVFTLYALDTVLDIPEDSSRENLLSTMEGHVIDSSELIGIYGR